MKCKNCKKTSFKKILKLGKQPLSGFFYEKKITNLKTYSLDLYKCNNCNLVQLKNEFISNKLFGKNYGYETAVSNLMVSHLNEKKKKLIRNKYVKKKSKILDIGCNDGTFLNLFKNSHDLFGIDPSAIKFKKKYNKNIELITDYFSKKNLLAKINKKTKFDLITSFAVFYDIDDPNAFCNDIDELLMDNGVWVCEFSYLPLMLKNLTFDQICHEHLTYYTVNVFEKIINKSGLRILDLSLNEINGGSIEIIVCKKNSNHKSNLRKIEKIKKDENKINDKSYLNFQNRVINIKKELISFLVKNKGTIGYGASTKGNIILNFCKIKSNNLNFICDANPKKINKYTPGSNIKIITKSKMRKINPKNLLILIWSFRKEVIKQEKNFIKNGGNLIFHLPKFHIVNKKNYNKVSNQKFSEISYNY